MMPAFHECVDIYLQSTGPVLALDIGSGTQDVLLAIPGQRQENWSRFVVPAPSRSVATRIAACTACGQSIWLYGSNMGGGFAAAIRTHREAGLAVACTHSAAAALHDNPERVCAMGVTLSDVCPVGHAPIHLADFAPGHWATLLAALGLPTPVRILAAAQDHGCHPETGGNRLGRMVQWKTLLREQRTPPNWLYDVPPPSLTRLATLAAATGGPVADTGTAAVLGALSMPEVAERSQRQGVTLINVGNSHILAFLIFREQVYGIYEHHTGQRTLEELLADLKDFRLGWLPDELVREQGGHGVAFTGDMPPEAEGFAPTFVLGPQRERLRGHGQFVAPHGDMMLAGAYGLLYAAALRHNE